MVPLWLFIDMPKFVTCMRLETDREVLPRYLRVGTHVTLISLLYSERLQPRTAGECCCLLKAGVKMYFIPSGKIPMILYVGLTLLSSLVQ